MEYIGESRIEVDFQYNVTPYNSYNLIKNEVAFFENSLIDLSAFTFLLVTELKFFASNFDSYTVFTNSFDVNTIGLYVFAISQHPKVISSDFIVFTFDQALALIGGYAGIIWMLIGFVTGWY